MRSDEGVEWRMDEIGIGDWSKLGVTLKARRLTLGLSQSEIATRARVARSWLAKVEGGHRGAEFEQILRLLAALQFDLVLRPQGVQPSAEGPGAKFAADPRVSDELRTRHRGRAATRRRAWTARSGGDATNG
jgi:transcriptional regulator with XRE-family HTH domain